MVTIAQRMYIDGRWRDAQGNGVFDVVDPATRKMIERVPDVSRVGGHPGQGTGADPRPHPDRLESETEAIARLIVLENGKPFEEAKKEVAFALGYFGRIVDINAIRRRSPDPWPGPPDVICHSQTPRPSKSRCHSGCGPQPPNQFPFSAWGCSRRGRLYV